MAAVTPNDEFGMERVRRFAADERGGISLEATLALPFFLAFVLALVCLIRLTVADLALHHAVSETVKQMAANAYPVQLLAEEARKAYEQSPVGGQVDGWLGHIRVARDKLVQGEQWVDDYKAFIPDALVQWVEWERQKREQAEKLGRDEYDAFVKERIDPYVRSAFKLAVVHYSDSSVLKEDRLAVVEATVPSFTDPERRFVGIEAEYAVKLPIPFVNKTVTLRKKAYERIWTGA
ncbi:TadE/TadG family type IV pilus assembly protein [Paenibacillus flagellatus]|uniref:Uncharacterized protein n=1 Tax=Paenibacillus flagellatus TaxID=2211139 RepID=A0A2V5L019_9BACL|nr:hypothetical protein [Paenibacillus flagellatus]PYI55876.1 hypothetical protein DLM86_09180 [Paenibacillus flagellatus]